MGRLDLPAAEFDEHARDYLDAHRVNIAITGEDPDYFARAKIVELRRRWDALGLDDPDENLDFGSGIGSSLPHLAEVFPAAKITALDVSATSLETSRARFPDLAERVHYDGLDLPFRGETFDLVFTACVFHHIPAALHIPLLTQLRKAMTHAGVLTIWEHNPYNPVTRHIVATCPFDANAVLIPARHLVSRQCRAGFKAITTQYCGFFPKPLAALRPLEPALGWLPVGAQYYTLARA
jgi:SAM-dependent methyltransferase